MRRRDFIALVGASAAAWPMLARSQQATKVPRVALVTAAIALDQIQIGKDVEWSAFLDQMVIHGFVEGRTVTYDRYLVNATVGTNEDNARRVLAGGADLIFWGGAIPTALPGIAMNKTIPMVALGSDLLERGVVSSLAHPGGNVTGVSTDAGPDFAGKLLAVLAEAVPGAKTFAYTNSGADGRFDASKQPQVQSISNVAAKLGLTMVPIVYAAGGGEGEFTKALAAVAASKAEMIVFGQDNALAATAQQLVVAKLALAARLPSIAVDRGFVDAGGLLSYGQHPQDWARRSADYVALILNGSKPGDLPVFQPIVFELVVNLKTANAIGVTIPHSLLLQATEVIQ